MAPGRAQDAVNPRFRARAFSPTTERTIYPLRQLGEGVFAVLGDSGQGVEGRPNAGFVVTKAGVVAVGGLASPAQARAVLRTIRTVTRAPVRWLVLYAHHPDMQFGAIEFRRAGARVIAHPDTRVLAGEAGPEAMLAGWLPVVGVREMLGFAYANVPDRPVTGIDTLELGGRRLVLWHPGPAHSAGDLMLWVPDAGVLFAGDVVVEDGLTMVVDGESRALLRALDAIDSIAPRVLVPGHGRLPEAPSALVATTRAYVTGLRAEVRAAMEAGQPMHRWMRGLPPADDDHPVSVNSRRRRNAARVWVEVEKEMLLGRTGHRRTGGRADGRTVAWEGRRWAGAAQIFSAAGRPRDPGAWRPRRSLGPLGRPSARPPAPPVGLLSTDSLAAWIARGRPHRLLDVRGDVFTYLEGHLPGAAYLNVETARMVDGGMPVELLDAATYRTLWARLGVRLDQPVVIHGAGETKNIDATFIAWLLAGFGHPQVYLLDGGFSAWKLEQREIARAYPRFPRAPGWAARPFAPRMARLADVRRAMQDGRTLLVDARPPEQYRGEAGAQMRRGHIPGAISHYWQDDLETRGFGRVFKPLDALRASYEAQGITPDRPIIVYCNSATEASHNWVVLAALLGYPDVRVYVPSWTEWASVAELPVATGER
ncbi:MAG: rhodanese-like domain-containing protein [Gemmatimonadales bacterium]|nr:rhodanese-like domain-containing protein [Gemmatimonadales bacterium]